MLKPPLQGLIRLIASIEITIERWAEEGAADIS